VQINVLNFVIQLVTFGILFLLLKKYAFGPLLGVMEKRQKQVEEQIKGAEANRIAAEKLLQEQQEELKKTRLEANEIIENSRKLSAKQAAEILEASKQEAKRLKEQALQDIVLEKEKAINELREQVSSLSVLIAAKMIEKELDVKTQSKLIDNIMKQVGEGL